MLDVSEKIGQSACRELQKEFRPSDVTFMTTDVTNSEQLVIFPFYLFPECMSPFWCTLHIYHFAINIITMNNMSV